MKMSMFKDAAQEQSYLKMGVYSEAGAGKTYTMSLIAIGLHKYIKSQKPITFFDTEAGSDYVFPILFKPSGIRLKVVKSRSFSDLMAAYEEAQSISDIFIGESLYHVWNELQESYKKKNNIQRIEFQDWNILKPEWNKFTTMFLNASIHSIVGSRSKDDYEYVQNERGKKELNKTGTRMATEKNLSYEPSLLVEMEKVIDPKTNFWIPRAWVLKDRFDQIDGKAFDKPTFETFLPHIQMLNLGGKQGGVDTSRTSEALFSADDGEAIAKIRHDQAKWVDEIEQTLIAAYPGRSADETKKKLDLLHMAFGAYGWETIKSMKPDVLLTGLGKIKEAITADLAAIAANGEAAPKKKEKVK
jgi:hypothetical protein